MKKIESVENTGSACRKMYMTPLGEALDIEISFMSLKEVMAKVNLIILSEKAGFRINCYEKIYLLVCDCCCTDCRMC